MKRKSRNGRGLRRVLAVAEDRDGVLDLERGRRGDVLDRVALALGEERLVLVAEQHVARPLEEGLGRLAARLRLDLDVVGDELLEEGEPGGRVLAALALGGVRARGGSTSPSRS